MEKIRLEECCDILDSMRVPITAKDRKKGPYPYYGANGVQDYVADYIFDDELVLLAEDGGNFGSEVKPIAYKISGKCWVNNHAHVLKPKEGIDVDYLCYSLMFYKVDGMVNGATRKKLTQAAMREMLIPLRRIEKQKEIVGILNKVQTLIQKEREQIELYDKLVKARFVEMFGDPLYNPLDWEKSMLSSLLDVVGGYAFKSDGFKENGIPVLRIGNINSGYFVPVNMVYWQDDSLLNRYKVYPGDLVISLTGTVGKNDYGNVCVLGNDYDEYYLNQRNAKLELSEKLERNYLSELLKFPEIKHQLTGISRGIRQANISNKDILNLNIPVPPIKLQKEFNFFAQQVVKLKSTTKESLAKLQTLQKSLMQQYFIQPK